MQTLEFTRALTEITKELKIAELCNLLQPWLAVSNPVNTPIPEEQKDRFSSLILSSHARYDWLHGTGAAGKILSQLNIQEFYEPGRIRRMIFTVGGASNVGVIRGNFEFYTFFETLRAILKLEATCRNLLEAEKVGRVRPSDGVLELELIDYDGAGIEPVRLLRIISLLTRLYMNLARILGVQDDKLKFKYLDSGSDLLMAIQGAKVVIESMGTLFLQFWDKVRFRHQDTFERDVEALSRGLDFMTKVQDAVEKHALTEEEARNLKTRVFRGVNELVKLGVTLPLGDSSVDQRQLLIEKRDTKLLGTGLPTDDDEEGVQNKIDFKPSEPGPDVAPHPE